MGRFLTANIEEGARPMGGGLPKLRHKAKAAAQTPPEGVREATDQVSGKQELTSDPQEAPQDTGKRSSRGVFSRSLQKASTGGDKEPEASPEEDAAKMPSHSEPTSLELDARAEVDTEAAEEEITSSRAVGSAPPLVQLSARVCTSAADGSQAKQLRSSQKMKYRCCAIHSRKATFGRSKLNSRRNLDCRAFEEEHPPISARDLAESAMQKAEDDGEDIDDIASMLQEYNEDAVVQAKVLSSLGIRSQSVLGQRTLVPEVIPQMIGVECETIARKIFRKNSFEQSIKPAARALSKSGMWPLIMSRRMQGHITEVPTLELCAAVCTRILCVARRLRSMGGKTLVFLGVGSGDALVEASIALHLGHVLGQQVVLSRSPLKFTYEGDFQILFLATDTANYQKRIEGRSSEVFAQMAVQQYDLKDAVTDFAREAAALYVFASWPPETENWRELIEEAAGHKLKELCFLQPPPCLRRLQSSAYASQKLRATELFPKTLCRQDYFSHGFSDGPEVSLHHSQLYLWTPKQVPRPYLAPQLEHTLGSFEHRMKANPALEGLHYFHRVGLSHARCPEDLSVRLPDKILDGLKNLLYHQMHGIEVADFRKWLRDALRFAEGPAEKQLDLLIKNSAYRMYQTEKTGKQLVASMDPALGKLLGGVNSRPPQQHRALQSADAMRDNAVPHIQLSGPNKSSFSDALKAKTSGLGVNARVDTLVGGVNGIEGLASFQKLYGISA